MIRRAFAVALTALALPGLLAAQADSTGPMVGLSFRTAPLVLTPPRALSATWLGASARPGGIMAGFDSALAATLDSARAEDERSRRLASLYRTKKPAVQQDTSAASKGLLGINRNYVDLSVEGLDRFEARVERVKNLKCSSASALDAASSCSGNGFRAPRLDNALNIRASGLLARRLHLDVDYDTQRDLATKNSIQIYYQGLEDEVVQRIEVGTVTFQPPPSRFITAATPLNNFGVNASFQVGPVQIQGIVATQKGSSVAERTYTIGQTTSQPQDRQVRDLDFESGRFFWVKDPALIPGYPKLDILNIDPTVLPVTQRPVSVRIYRYRPVSGQGGVNPNLGGITAVARRSDSPQRVGPLASGWHLMVPGQDYYLDPSGLWFFLSSRIDINNDYLAVSYITQAGDTVGSFPQVDNPARKDSLELIVEPKVNASLPTFRYEMRQVYRVSGSDLDRSSLRVGITVNRSERPLKPLAATYLALLGLAVPTDATLLDLDNRVFPRNQDPVPDQVSRDAFIIFPSAQPFADSTLLSTAELQDSMYRTPYYLLFQEGPPAKFLLRLQYNSTGAGDQGTLNLNALDITEGSEVLTLNGRSLARGVDYTVAYDLGQVTFLNPGALFGGQPAYISVRFEEKGLFAVAPTQLYGFSSRYSLGATGGVSLIGIYQAEQSAYNRPQLGFEATSNLIGGITTDLHFHPNGITRFFNKLTSTPAIAPSSFDINAEAAYTKPNENRAGAAYVEDFEGDNGLQLSLRETAWGWGSVPESPVGVEDIVGTAFDSADAAQLIWQNLIANSTGGVTQLRPSDIDPLVQTAGGDNLYENVLYLTLHPDVIGGLADASGVPRWVLPERLNRPRWRSIVTPLSTTGLDLSRDEFLEFWVFEGDNRSADSAGVKLVIDLGTVNEDALALAPLNFTVNGKDTTFTGRQYVGVGHLDTERDSLTQVWNATDNDHGILQDRPDSLLGPGGVVRNVALCQIQLSATVLVYNWGDVRSRCSNGNGFADTEDQNGDGVLNATGAAENLLRWVVDPTSLKYYVREGVKTATGPGGWKLFRVPIRAPDDSVGSPDIRLIRSLRVTVVAANDAGQPDIKAQLALARMRFVGAPWVRRAGTPIASLAGSLGEPHGDVEVSTASTEDAQLQYTSPPGVVTATNQVGGSQGDLGTQINEKSLRIVATDLRLHERAEAYLRVLGSAQNFLKYSRMRVWFRGRGAGWNEGDYQAYIRVGTDDGNFYQYSQPANTAIWNPEAIVDLTEWVSLRTGLEVRFLDGLPPDSAARVACGGDTVSTAYVACSGGYLVYLSDPGVRPPNLSAVQELATGILRVSDNAVAQDAELWIDDVRLDQPVSKTGQALALDARLVASDVADMQFSFVDQNGYFQQINTAPSYQATGQLSLSGGVRLDRFLPRRLGLSIPFTASYGRTLVNPILFSGSDIETSQLTGLRKPQNSGQNYSLTIRRNVQGKNWATRFFIDPLSLTGNYSLGKSQTEFTQANTSAYSLLAGYTVALARHNKSLGLGGVASWLPRFMREGEFGKGLQGATFNLVPTSIRASSGLTRVAGNQLTFQSPVFLSSDTAVVPTLSLVHLWRNSAGFTLQPLGMLLLGGDIASTRDLREYSDSTTLGRVVNSSRKSFLGIDAGVERDRSITTTLNITPRLASWLRPRFLTNSTFFLLRSLTTVPPIQVGPDSIFILPQTLNNLRGRELGLNVDAAKLVASAFGDKSGAATFLRGFRPFDFSDRLVRSSSYDMASFDPDLSFMLGLGGLEDFLSHQGEQALSALETRTGTIAGGANLGFGVSFQLAYSRIRSDRLQRQGDVYQTTETLQREWPSGSLRLTRALNKGPFSVITLGTTYRQRNGTITQAGAGGNQTLTRSNSFNPDATVTFRNGMALAMRYLSTTQDNQAFDNLSRSTQQNVTGTFSYTLRLPETMSKARRAVRTSLSGGYTVSQNCLASQGSPDCRLLSDVRREELQAGLDTELMKVLTGGLQAGYVLDDARSLDRKVSQLFISLNFTLSLFAGDYR
ncbi:MAG TPA: cell surface protein SprA [Gemmatimonadales bacterium]|nr:cell surface protein SprA [Gemmatimonadales bacterium]